MVQAPAIDDSGRTEQASHYRIAMAQAARLLVPVVEGVSPVQQLLDVPASWQVHEGACSSRPAARGRLLSPRVRGVAPVYPHAADPADMREGRLVAFPAGFVLEPSDPRRPCFHIARSTVGGATFYRDAFDLTLSTGARFVVHTEAVEQVDSIFRAYFWNPVG